MIGPEAVDAFEQFRLVLASALLGVPLILFSYIGLMWWSGAVWVLLLLGLACAVAPPLVMFLLGRAKRRAARYNGIPVRFAGSLDFSNPDTFVDSLRRARTREKDVAEKEARRASS